MLDEAITDVPKIFNPKRFLGRYDEFDEGVVKLTAILRDALEERLVFFSKNFASVVEQRFNKFIHDDLVLEGDLEKLPFADNSFDLVLNVGSLLITNDIPGALRQWYACLKPGGVFMGAFFGNETLFELKTCFYETEEKLKTGNCARFLPMIQTKDAGALLYRAGFTCPSSDVTRHVFYVNDVWEIFRILRAMGGNCCYRNGASRTLARNFVKELNAIYNVNYGTDKGLPVSVDVVALTGWAIAMDKRELLQQRKVKSIGFA